MKNSVVAVLVSEGAKIISEVIRQRISRGPQVMETENTRVSLEPTPYVDPLDEIRPVKPIKKPTEGQLSPIKKLPKPAPAGTMKEKASSIVSGCLPCATGHLGTCSGLLNEAVRFSDKENGVANPEVIDRINMCLDELNSMERVDLSPEMIVELPPWERTIAEAALQASRKTRHQLEAIDSKDALVELAAKTTSIRKEIGRAWFENKLAHSTPEQQEALVNEVRRLPAPKVVTPESTPEE